jgi:hypothetical protein
VDGLTAPFEGWRQAVEGLEAAVDIGIISKQLGHRSILTTIRYLAHIAPVVAVQAMRGRGK